MSEIRSSQRRRLASQRDSSVTQVRVELPSGVASTASIADDQATVISSRPPGSESSTPPPLFNLEVGKLLEGERLGQFELRQFVGGGGMGVVFRGWDTTLNREVAVKVLSRDQSADDETLRRFRNEAQSAARLDHGNIARVYYVGEDRGVHYIVFEFIEGVNLRDLVDRRGRLPVEEAIDYTLQVAEALDHASQRDVIHRDIKPSNVLITAEGHAKLVDMGLARLHQVEHTNDDLTASGVTLGTFDYISPEQARDPRSADVRSDLYSLGCSLYFMLVGQPPFPHGTVLQKLLQHQGEEPPDPRTLRPDLPNELVKIVRKLLSKAPTQRYQLPVDLIRDLYALRERLEASPTAARQSAWSMAAPLTPRRWRKHVPWAAPLTALVLITLALDFYWSRADRAAELVSPAPGKDTESSANGEKKSATAEQSSGVDTPKPSFPDSRNGTDSASGKSRVAEAVAKPDKVKPAPPSVPLSNDEVAKKTPLGTAESKETKVTPAETIASEVRVAETSADPPASAKSPGANGVLVVGDPRSGAAFSTLESAIRAAKSGDVVELCYNGGRDEVPLSVTNMVLTIRAGEGFAPAVRFAPTEPDPIKSPRSMFAVAGGSVTFVRVAVEFVVPREIAADSWTMFELRSAERLRFEQSSLTIRNATAKAATLHPSVAFFTVANRIGAGPVSSTGDEANNVSAPAPLVDIELQDFVVRGEATMARISAGESVRLFCDNGLLATTERLLVAGGKPTIARAARVELEARHVTADVRNGLASIDFSDADVAGLLVDLRVASSIVCIGSGVPLVQQVGPPPTLDAESALSWSGDRNFYEGIDIFWQRFDSADSTVGSQLTFAQWQAYWTQSRETLPYTNSVVWRQLPARDRPVHEYVPLDFALSSTTANNPARDSASDGLDVGCILKQLPPLP